MAVKYPLSQTTLAYGEAMARALLGVDALYRSESGDQDGLVVLNMDTSGRLEAEAFSSYEEAGVRFSELSDQAGRLPETDRRVYYRELCLSTLAFMTWQQNRLAFVDQLMGFLHVSARPADEGELEHIQEELHDLLGEMGYAGDLRTRCAAWEERNRVPGKSALDVLDEFLATAWDRANATLLPVPTAQSDRMRARGVSGVAYNARCDYLARTIEVNTDPVLTRPGLKHLAVREGYAGHYVQFKLREEYVARGLAPADNLLSLVNSASSCVVEGIADAAMEMMDWTRSDDDRVQALLNRYRAGIGTGAAWRLHALGWSVERTGAWLRRESLVGGEGWIQNRMAFMQAPARSVLIWSHWWGESVVRSAWRRVGAERRRDFLEFLYGRMHSIRSLREFS